MPPFDPVQFNVLLANYAALLVLLPVALLRHRCALLDGISLSERVGIVGAAFTGLLIRMTSLGFRHENGHAYRLLDQAVDPSADLHVYGSGYIALFHPLFLVFPPLSEVLIIAVMLLGAITVIPAGLLVTRLFGPGTGVVSALSLAFLNSHAIHSASESRFVVVLAFLILALWLATEVRRTERMDVALACALAAAPAAQMRIELIFTPLVVLAFAFFLRGDKPLWRRPAGWILTGALTLLLAGHVRWIWTVHASLEAATVHERLPVGAGFFDAIANGSILLDESLLPRLKLALAVMTVVLGFRVRRREVILLGATALGLVLLYAQTSFQFAELQRFTVPAQTFVALLAGPGALALGRLAEKRSAIRGVAPAVSALLVMAGANVLALGNSSLSADEYYLLSETYDAVPKGCHVVALGQSEDDLVLPAYSRHELLHRTQAKKLHLIGGGTDREIAEALASNAECVLYLRTAACFAREVHERDRFREDGHTPAVQPRCARFERHFEIESLETDTLKPESFGPSRFSYPNSPFEIGFFRVTGVGGQQQQQQHRDPAAGNPEL